MQHSAQASPPIQVDDLKFFFFLVGMDGCLFISFVLPLQATAALCGPDCLRQVCYALFQSNIMMNLTSSCDLK